MLKNRKRWEEAIEGTQWYKAQLEEYCQRSNELSSFSCFENTPVEEVLENYSDNKIMEIASRELAKEHLERLEYEKKQQTI